MQWVEKLAENQTPSWLGLPNNAEKVLLTTQGVLCLTSSNVHEQTQSYPRERGKTGSVGITVVLELPALDSRLFVPQVAL